MRNTTSGTLVTLPVLGLTLLGCATNETVRTVQGQSGPVAQEVSDIRQTIEDSGRRLRWDYPLTLRNTSSTAITCETVVRNIITPRGDVSGGMASETLVHRLDVGADWRTVGNSYSHGCSQCDPSSAAEVLRRGVTRILEFAGRDDQGRTVTVTVRIPLNSGVGGAKTDKVN
jgi:hypothetical protein